MEKEWKDIEYFSERFDLRTAKLIDLLDDSYLVKDVLDIGCGLMFAKRYLYEKYGINNYYGLDYKSRDNETIICDLNKKEFPSKYYDLFLVAGCLEYIKDVQWFFSRFVFCKKYALISYCSVELVPDLEKRRNGAWKNDLTALDIKNYMSGEGFVADKEVIDAEFATNLFLFKRKMIS